MKTIGLVAVFAFMVSAFYGSTVSAAATREDGSSLVVWIFLGFCALIVIAQLLPLLLHLKIFARTRKEELPEASSVKVTSDK